MSSTSNRVNLSRLPLVHVDGLAYAQDAGQSGVALLTIGGIYESSAPTYSDGDATVLRTTSDGKLMVDTELTLDGNVLIDNIPVYATNINNSSTASLALVDTDGHVQVDVLSAPSASSLAEDSAHTSGDAGTMTLAVRNDTLASLVDADGDYAPLQVDSEGSIYVNVARLNGMQPALGAGAVSAGTQRVTVATDDTVMSGIMEATTPPTPGTAQSISTSTVSAVNSSDFTKPFIRLYSPVDTFYVLGNSGSTATTSDHLLPGGISYDLSVGSNTRVAAVLSAGTSTLYITEWD